MWVKVDDRFPDHRKVFAAGAHLGPRSTGRVLAIWLEAMCWTNHNKTDGFLPIETVRTFKHDRQPLKVAAAMVRECRRPDGTMGPGLWLEADGGFSVHDYGDHNDREKFSRTSSARAEAGRRGGINSGEARRQASAKQLLQQSGGNVASARLAIANPVPVPDPEDREVQEQRGEAPRRNPQLVEKSPEEVFSHLVALVCAELDAHEFEDDVDCREHMKSVAAQAHLPYDSPTMGRALDKAVAMRAARATRKARAS